MTFLNFLISGISLGSIYAIIALGYTMVYGIAKMLNFAHGDIIMVGGYISFCAMSYLSLPGWLATLLAMAVAVAVYFFLVVFLQLLSREDLALMPKGEKLADLLRLPRGGRGA